MNADVVEARARFAEAERTLNLKVRSELYFQASKLYLKAVPFVADDSLKRSLIYLSSTCVVKASNCVPTREIATNKAIVRDEEVAITLNSERVLQVAHLTHLQKTKNVRINVPLRMEANAVQTVRDMLDLETALANIGFVNPVINKNTPPPSEQLLRSTFAFNSDLGESFMVLDTKGKQHSTNTPMYSHMKGVGTSGTQPAQAISREVPRRTGGATGEVAPRSGQTAHMRPTSHRTDSHLHPPPRDTRDTRDARDARAESRQLQNTRSEIENELNNPLVQSYLSTHAPAAMAQSHFDFENLTQSTISTFNKDTIDNAEGVLNLLQTVRRIGDENAQLLLKIEMLSHLEERSVKVYRDIDRFKEDFEEKLECVRDMLTEFIEASTAAVLTPDLPPLTAADTASGATNPATAAKPPLQLQVLNDIIHRELESRRAAVAARKASLEAEERAAREKAAARGIVMPPASSASRSGMGIAEQHHGHSSSSAPAVGRQQQLEKMVKALVARQEKSNAEIKKKNELLDRYVRIINQFQKDHPTARLAALDGSTMAVGPSEGDVHVPMPVRRSTSRSAFAETTIQSVPSMETVEEGDLNAESEGADGSESAEARDNGLKLDLAAAAVAASGTGGVVSTFRKPASSSASSSGVGGIMSPPRGSGSVPQGMPSPPGSAVRTSSGGASSALRKSSLVTLPPRSKHHSTTTLEVLQKNAKL